MSISTRLMQGNAVHAASQVEAARQRVDAESPVRGRQPLKLAAAQLAIAFAAHDEKPDDLADRLMTLSDETADYHPADMAERALTERELNFFPAAQAVVGLIAESLAQGLKR